MLDFESLTLYNTFSFYPNPQRGHPMLNVVNLTPHSITLRDSSDTDTIIPASGQIARVAATTSFTGQSILGLPIQTTTYSDVEGLPNPCSNTVYIVSSLVLGALNGSGRTDVFSPATGPQDNAIRNEKGHITAVTRLNTIGS